MLLSLLFHSVLAAAAPPDLRISFESYQGKTCEIALRASSRPGICPQYNITRRRFEPAPRETILNRFLLRLIPGANGTGAALFDNLLGIYLSHHQTLLDDFIRDVPIDPAITSARATMTAEQMAVIRAAHAFSRGERPGRGYRLDVRAPITNERRSGHELLLLLPDDVYPAGVLMGRAYAGPTNDALLNVRPIDGSTLSGTVLPVTVSQRPGRRGDSYLVIARPPPVDIPDVDITSEIIVF